MNKLLHDIWISIASFTAGILVSWVPITTFFIGLSLGFILGKLYYQKDNERNKEFFKGTVSLIIVLVWSFSVLVDITEGSTNTPFMLHLFMGSVLGAINHEFGNWLLKFIQKK